MGKHVTKVRSDFFDVIIIVIIIIFIIFIFIFIIFAFIFIISCYLLLFVIIIYYYLLLFIMWYTHTKYQFHCLTFDAQRFVSIAVSIEFFLNSL